MYVNTLDIYWTNYQKLADADSTEDEKIDEVLNGMPVLLLALFPECKMHAWIDAEDEENYFQSTVKWHLEKVSREIPALLEAIDKIALAYPITELRMDLADTVGNVEHVFARNGAIV